MNKMTYKLIRLKCTNSKTKIDLKIVKVKSTNSACSLHTHTHPQVSTTNQYKRSLTAIGGGRSPCK